ANVIGEEGAGWDVAMLLLSFERGSSALPQYAAFRREVDDIIELAGTLGRQDDPNLRQKIARSIAELECLRYHSLHLLTQVEQRALQATVREFLTDRFPLTSVRALYDEPDGDGDPSELWKAVGEQGWLAVTIEEQYDGLGLGLLDAAVLARCWGEGCAPGPF